MKNRSFYNEILTEHNLNPIHKERLADADLILEGINPSCGDDIWLQLKMKEEKIIDGAFYGNGCAICQASADIMLELIIGKEKAEVNEIINIFMSMIKGSITEDEMKKLDEAAALQDISHMPARVKCAVLSWHTLEEMIK